MTLASPSTTGLSPARYAWLIPAHYTLAMTLPQPSLGMGQGDYASIRKWEFSQLWGTMAYYI